MIALGDCLGRNVGTDDLSDGHRIWPPTISLSTPAKIPFGPRNTAKQVQAERAKLGKGVAGEMRFGEQAEAGNSPSLRKLMPLGFADRPQLQIANDPLKQRPQSRASR